MLSSTTPTHTSLLPQFGVSAWECGELTAAITQGIINNVKVLIFDDLGIIIYRLSYEIFILRCSPFFFFFWQPSYLLFLCFPVKGEACDIIYGDPFSFSFPFFFCSLFFLSWMRWGVRNLIDVQFAVSSFYTIYEPLPHAAYWMFFNLDGHTFFFSDTVKRGHIQAMLCSLSTFFTPLGRFFKLFFGLLSFFRSILVMSFSVDYTCHVAMASTFALWRKMFLK